MGGTGAVLAHMGLLREGEGGRSAGAEDEDLVVGAEGDLARLGRVHHDLAGGVIVGVKSADEAKAAYDTIIANAKKRSMLRFSPHHLFGALHENIAN